MLNKYEELNEDQIDVLREIGNIGAGNAATALAQILDERVEIKLPEVRIIPFDEVVYFLGGPEAMTVGVLMNFYGDASGIVMFLLDTTDAASITDFLIVNDDVTEVEEEFLSELKLSAIKEIGNILGSSYINSLASLTGLKIHISVPSICIDMAGAIMSVPIIEFGSVGDKVMFIEESFIGGHHRLESNLILFAEIDTLKKILESLGMN